MTSLLRRSWRPPIGLLGILLGNVACPGTLVDPARFAEDAGDGLDSAVSAAACPDIPSTVFVPICATAGCHSSMDKAQGLDLQSPSVASRLVGVCATEGSGTLVDPANPSQSVVYTKVTPDPPFGARMPSGKTALDDATIACVLSWITAQQSTGASCGTGTLDADVFEADVPDADLSDAGTSDAEAHDGGHSEASSPDGSTGSKSP